jgi:LysM repeat protein
MKAKRVFFGTLVGVVCLLTLLPPRVSAQSSEPYDIIAMVNQIRAGQGLPAYEIDPILMAVAQSHNDWRAASGLNTHVGPDGSRPVDRVTAAGYGECGTVFVSENIVSGMGMTPQGAIDWWVNSAPHYNTMVGANYVHTGAAFTSVNGTNYYLLLAAYYFGGTPDCQPSTSGSGSGVIADAPVVVATADAEGRIVHEVQTGQTLWTIAAAYEVEVADLLELNNMTAQSFIYPGQELIISLDGSPAPSAEPSEAPATQAPTRTPQPTSTPGPTRTPAATATPEPERVLLENSLSRGLVMAGVVIVLLAVALGIWRREV